MFLFVKCFLLYLFYFFFVLFFFLSDFLVLRCKYMVKGNG